MKFRELSEKNWIAYLPSKNVFGGSILLGFICAIGWIWSDAALAETGSLFSIKVANGDEGELMPALKIVAVLSAMTLAPALLLTMTSFTRILIVLSFVRQAIGTQTMPPNQIIIGLSLFLTFFTMSPLMENIYDKGLKPFMDSKISHEEAFERIGKPLKSFMLGETRKEDLLLFLNISGKEKPEKREDVPMSTLVPSFMISELKTAFQIGFLIYIPFLVVDMVISSILMAMGMMMLPPTVVSLPFKLVLFVLVDGWSLIVSSIVKSFQTFG